MIPMSVGDLMGLEAQARVRRWGGYVGLIEWGEVFWDQRLFFWRLGGGEAGLTLRS